MGVVLACQVALPVFAQTGTTSQTTTDTTTQEGQTTDSTGQSGETGTTDTTQSEGTSTTGSTEVTALPTITSDSYIVMNADTGQVLISKNPDKKQYPSSIT